MSTATIKIVGLGGLGCRIVHGLMGRLKPSIRLIAVDSDHDFLSNINAHSRVLIGNKIEKGQDLQENNEHGKLAASERNDKLLVTVREADMLFLLAGMGGHVGTRAVTEVARIAREAGALTVAMVTKPFTFEGTCRNTVAENGLALLKDSADTIIVLSNNRVIPMISPQSRDTSSFNIVDPLLIKLVKNAAVGLTGVITEPPLICISFNDVKEILSNAGYAYMGTGYGSGKQRAINAARAAIESPLLGALLLRKATRIMVIIRIGLDGTIYDDIRAASDQIAEAVNPEANIIVGGLIEHSKIDFIHVTLIATGFRDETAL